MSQLQRRFILSVEGENSIAQTAIEKKALIQIFSCSVFCSQFLHRVNTKRMVSDLDSIGYNKLIKSINEESLSGQLRNSAVAMIVQQKKQKVAQH